MLRDKENFSARLAIMAGQLHQIQLLMLEDIDCPEIMRELTITKQALSSLRMDLILCSVESCLSTLQNNPDCDGQVKELKKLADLFSVA